jgi:hypothetical protein
MKRVVLCVCFLVLFGSTSVFARPLYYYASLNATSFLSDNDIWFVGSGWKENLFGLLHWNGKKITVPTLPTIPTKPAEYQYAGESILALSKNDVWAMGYVSLYSHLLIYHFDGWHWHQVIAPIGIAYVSAMSALSSTDIWAVGSTITNSVPYIMHWNGQTWKHISNPDSVSGGIASLSNVSALSSTDIWVAGYHGGNESPVLAHWNGQQWNTITAPHHQLSNVVVLSDTDIWETGGDIEHWNGQTWTSFPLQYPYSLTSMSALSSTDIWAVGAIPVCSNLGCNPGLPLIKHWNGHTWKIVDNPILTYRSDPGHGVLVGVHAFSSRDIWVSGLAGATVFLEHWNGQTWTPITEDATHPE